MDVSGIDDGRIRLSVLSVDDAPGTLSSSSNPVIRVIEDATRFYLESYHRLGHGYLAHLHDPLAAAVALDPQLVATAQATVDVELTAMITALKDTGANVITVGIYNVSYSPVIADWLRPGLRERMRRGFRDERRELTAIARP